LLPRSGKLRRSERARSLRYSKLRCCSNLRARSLLLRRCSERGTVLWQAPELGASSELALLRRCSERAAALWQAPELGACVALALLRARSLLHGAASRSELVAPALLRARSLLHGAAPHSELVAPALLRARSRALASSGARSELLLRACCKRRARSSVALQQAPRSELVAPALLRRCSKLYARRVGAGWGRD